MPRKAKHSITVYALCEDIKRPADAIKQRTDVKHQSIQLGRATGHLYIVAAKNNRPRWARILEGKVDFEDLGIRSAGAYGVFLIKTRQRMFALTLGGGRHLLRNDVIEERFGLKTTLNAIESASIRSLDRKSFEALSRQVHEQATRPATVPEFGLDIEQDMLRAVVGKPRDPTLADRLHGKDSLVAIVDHGLERIIEFLERCDTLSRGDSYKEKYPWVDNMAEISSRARIDQLNNHLLDRIKTHDHDKLWLAIPEPIAWAQADGFKFSTSKKVEVSSDLQLSGFLETIKDPSSLTAKALRSKRVHYYVHDQQHPKESWSVYKCICFEASIGRDTYLLSGGKWYRIQRDFVEQVDEYVSEIRKSNLRLPECHEMKEADYNKRVCRANSATLTLLDTKNIMHGGGRSRIEVCDILTKDRQLIHVKRYGYSQALSHLFSQASVAAESLLFDESFRKKANDRLPKVRQFPLEGFDATQYEVIFCIITPNPDDFVLPFFSRVNLRSTVRRLRRYGYTVSTIFVRGPHGKPSRRKR